MDQEKIGKIIKTLRTKNQLTQSQLAEKLGVTYQAVSKWENGKNIPDISLLKQMSKEFNIDIDSLLEGVIKTPPKKQNSHRHLFILIIILISLIGLFLFLKKQPANFEFKTISASCNQFNITGSIAYNNNKSSIYISNINYCGGEDNNDYQKIECVLYETNQNVDTKISRYDYEDKKSIKLSEFLKNVKFHIDSYAKTCEKYSNNSLYLQINATDSNNKITSYKVPLSLEENCPNNH